jgi:hypothetical protein
MNKFKYSLGNDEDYIWGDIDIPWLVSQSVDAALQYTIKLDFLKVFFLLIACLYFIYELDAWKLIDSINFKQIGTDSIVLFRPKLS